MDGSLLESIALWSREQLSDAELKARFQAAEADVEEHKRGFARAVDELTPQQLKACRDLAEFAFDLLQALDAGLVDGLSALETGDRSGVFSAGDEMARASRQLNHAFEAFRQEALLALGPTRIPNFNQLVASTEEYLAHPDELRRDHLLEDLRTEVQLTEVGLSQLEGEQDIAEVATLRNQFQEQRRRLQRMSENLRAGRDSRLKADLKSLHASFTLLQEMVPKTQMALRGLGETDLPDLNHLLKLIDAVAQAEVGDVPLTEALEGCELAFSHTRSALESALATLDSVLARQEVEGLLQALDDFEEAVGLVYDFLDERQVETLQEGRRKLLQFGLEFDQRQKALREIEENQGMASCVHCSSPNPAERSRCNRCGFPLPKNIGAQATSTFESCEAPLGAPVVHGNLVKLYALINEVAEGGGTEEMLAEADRLESILTRNLDRVPAEPQETDQGKARRIAEVYDTLAGGADQMLAAFERLHSYAESGLIEELEQAILLLDEGAQMIAQAGEKAGQK